MTRWHSCRDIVHHGHGNFICPPPTALSVGALHKGPQLFKIHQVNFLALHRDYSFVLKKGKRTADRFNRYAEIAAYISAGHVQNELRWRVAARKEAVGKVEQKSGHPLVCAHGAEQQHDASSRESSPVVRQVARDTQFANGLREFSIGRHGNG